MEWVGRTMDDMFRVWMWMNVRVRVCEQKKKEYDNLTLCVMTAMQMMQICVSEKEMAMQWSIKCAN